MVTFAAVALFARGALVIVAFAGAVPLAAKVPLLAANVGDGVTSAALDVVALEARQTRYPSSRSWQSMESAGVLASYVESWMLYCEATSLHFSSSVAV